MSSTYVPGVCNIGKAEIRRRIAGGWIGLVIAAALWVALALAQVSPAWRFFVFLPATIGATGFLQAAFHFCAAFGMSGVFNFGAEVGKTDTVEQAEYRAKDRRKALLIVGLSVLVGVIVAVAAYFIP